MSRHTRKHTGLFPHIGAHEFNRAELPDLWHPKWAYRGPDHLKRQATAAQLGELFEHCGVGTASWAGTLGLHLMYDTWHRHDLKQWSRPNAWQSDMLQRQGKAVRTEWVMHRDTPQLDGPDLKNAYLTYFRRVPGGTARAFRGAAPEHMVTYFAWCDITIPPGLSLGVVPVHPGKHHFVREPGQWSHWLFREQIELAREWGYDIRVLGGFGWPVWCEDTAWWVDRMIGLREDAPGGRNGPIAGLVKAAAHCAMGLQGTGRERWKDRPDIHEITDARRQRPRVYEGEFIPGIQVKVGQKASMSHWERYTAMRTSCAVFELAEPYARRGELVAIQVDGLVLKRKEVA